LVGAILKPQLSWKLSWSDLSKIFEKKLIHPKTYEEIRALMQEPDEEVSLAHP
jgi:hypothetical protein